MGTSMKKSILLMFVLLMISCESGNGAENQESVELKQALLMLEKKGFDTKNYQILELPYGQNQALEKMISVENDCLFLIKDLLNESRDKQYHTNNLLSKAVASNLKIALRTSGAQAISSQWQNAFKDAIDNWNSIKGGLHTTYLKLNLVADTEPYDILVYKSNLDNPNVIASAGFPSINGSAFSSIYVNSGFTGYLTNAERLFAATHEMGHSIGFRHTNWFDRNSNGISGDVPYDNEGVGLYGANHIPGTPTGLDPNSVMNAIVQTWTGFSVNDKISVRYMYPKLNPGIFKKDFIEFFYDDPNDWPKFKLKFGPDPDPWKTFDWYYKELGRGNERWIPILNDRQSEGILKLPRDFRGTIQLLAIADDELGFISEEIRIGR
jgi:hypothetical protein